MGSPIIEHMAFHTLTRLASILILTLSLALPARAVTMPQAIISHEAAHIANGHLARRKNNLRNARTAADLGAALTVIAAAAGAGEAAIGPAVATQSAAQRSPLQASYGRALPTSGDTQGALKALQRARSIDLLNGSMLRDLSAADARTGQHSMAPLIAAEGYALHTCFQDIGIHVNHPMGLLPQGSGPWQRAQDVLIASERAAKKKRRR